VEDLRFTVERSQLRGLRIYTAVAAAAAVALAAAWELSRSGQAGMLALVAGLGAALGAYSWAAYARAFTECTPAGLRTRGLGGLRESTWPRITDIGLRPYGRTVTIMVTTAGGGRFRLGAPVAGGVMGDPGFARKAEQILAYWRETAGWPPAGGNPAALGSLLPGIADRAANPASVSERTRITLARCGSWDRILYWAGRLSFTVMIPLLGVMAGGFALRDIGPAWATHLGRGVPGVFTATTASRSRDCTQTCHTSVTWYGIFTPAHGSVISGVRLAEGGRITAVGQHEAGLYEGGGAVYPAGVGPDWILLTLMLAAGIAAVVFWIALLGRTLARRRRRRRPAEPLPEHLPV
jgi:hypothetical protein